MSSPRMIRQAAAAIPDGAVRTIAVPMDFSPLGVTAEMDGTITFYGLHEKDKTQKVTAEYAVLSYLTELSAPPEWKRWRFVGRVEGTTASDAMYAFWAEASLPSAEYFK